MASPFEMGEVVSKISDMVKDYNKNSEGKTENNCGNEGSQWMN